MENEEVFRPIWDDRAFPAISYGIPFPQAVDRHIDKTLHCSRVFVIISRSLSNNTDALQRLKDAMGDKIAGFRIGMRPHTWYSDILEIVKEVKTAKAECIVTLGGGTLIDGAKAVVMAISNEADTPEQLDKLLQSSLEYSPGKGSQPWQSTFRPTQISVICVTTTLSGGEYHAGGGATNDATQRKQLFYDPSSCPKIVVFDPELTETTPERVWLSTGVRAIDHCVEAICSINSSPVSDEAAGKGLRELLPALLQCKLNPKNLQARLSCQFGGLESMKSLALRTALGGSHGIGQQLGPLGVAHGETSCITLPSVMKYNSRVNNEKQMKVLDIIWGDKTVAAILEERGLVKGLADLGAALDTIIRELGLPRTLTEVGVGRDKLDGIAEHCVHSMLCKSNPIPLTQKQQILEILETMV